MSEKEQKVKTKKERERVRNKLNARRLKLKEEETRDVRFMNVESPGVELSFNYQSVQSYTLEDGKIYKLPISVIDHINDLAVPIYKMYDPKEEKSTLRAVPVDPAKRIIGKKKRFSLTPLTIKEAEAVEAAQETAKVANGIKIIGE